LLLPIGPDYVGTGILKEEEHAWSFTHASVDMHFSTRLAHVGSRKQARVLSFAARPLVNPDTFGQYAVEIAAMGMKTRIESGWKAHQFSETAINASIAPQLADHDRQIRRLLLPTHIIGGHAPTA
jgi:hypothetical protein